MNFNDLFNNGIAIACLSYFMYVTNTTLKSVSSSMAKVSTAILNNSEIIKELREDIREVRINNEHK
jgi:hypothetical protein